MTQASQTNHTLVGPMLDAMPYPAFLVDADVAIIGLNHAAWQMVGGKPETAIRRRVGEVLQCPHSMKNPDGCGSGNPCGHCLIRASARDAVHRKAVTRKKIQMVRMLDGEPKESSVAALVSPFNYKGQALALLQFEAFTELPERPGEEMASADPADDSARLERVNKVLIEVSDALRSTADLTALFRAIHTALQRIIDVSNFFIAIYQPDEDLLTFPYFADVNDDEFPIPNASESGSLTYEVIRTGKPRLFSNAAMRQWHSRPGQAVIGTPCRKWLGVPLSVEGVSFGAMVTQSYTDPLAFDENDASLLQSVAGQVALVIERKRAEEKLKASLAEKKRLINELRVALDKIKTLEGFIPICAACKKIRDDQGYWQQIEKYIEARSDAAFSHGICPECARKLYPDFIK